MIHDAVTLRHVATVGAWTFFMPATAIAPSPDGPWESAPRSSPRNVRGSPVHRRRPACHYHAYELPPIAAELNGWLDDVEALIAEVSVGDRASAAR